MKKRIEILLTALAAAMLLTGCGMRTVDQMYALPSRSEAFSHVQSAMDMAMMGLDFAAPVSGENQPTVQQADLDGDGVDEYILFARGTSEKPLNILIFTMEEEKCCLNEVIEFNGSSFERVEYVDIDNLPGKEMVVGRQLSDQIMGTVCVYSFGSGQAERLMNTACSQFLTCDFDGDSRSELVVVQPGEAASAKASVVRYQYRDGAMERSVENEASVRPGDIRRMVVGKLEGGSSAVYLSGVLDENTIATDVFAMRQDRFLNISAGRTPGVGVNTLRNYYVYADDIDNDGVLELPSLIAMRAVSAGTGGDKQYLIRWYSMDLQGREWDKLYTFHDYASGWYVELDSAWAERISVEQSGSIYTFYLWSKDGMDVRTLFKLYALTGTNREEEAAREGRFVLHRKEGTVYAAKLGTAAVEYGLTQDYLINSFRVIYQDWNTGET